MRKLVVVVGIALAVLAGPPPALADDYRCVDELVESAMLDNVIVPSGAGCWLEKTHVRGNVTVERDATVAVDDTHVKGNAKMGVNSGFFSSEGSVIAGNVTCDGCFFEDVYMTTLSGNVMMKDARDGSYIVESQIGGNLSIEQSAPGSKMFELLGNTVGGNLTVTKTAGPISITGNTIRGNLQLVENSGAVTITGNTASGNLQLSKTAGVFASWIFGNTISGNLQCAENQTPLFGDGNLAASKQGQCRLLRPS